MLKVKVKGALFASNNLLGDGLYIGPALRAWQEAHPDYNIIMVTVSNYVTDIYLKTKIPNLQVALVEGDFLVEVEKMRKHDAELFGEGNHFFHHFDVNKAFLLASEKRIHVAQAYAELLDVELLPGNPHDHENAHLRPLYYPVGECPPEQKGVILLSFHSMSCTSREGKEPNKMLPWAKWAPVIRYLRALDVPLRVLGAKEDRADELGFTEDEYLTGIPINDIALIMQQAKVLVTVDNGMSHLAASQDCPTFLLYPACLGTHYITPWGNKNLRVLQMDPRLITADRILEMLKRGTVLKELLEVRK